MSKRQPPRLDDTSAEPVTKIVWSQLAVVALAAPLAGSWPLSAQAAPPASADVRITGAWEPLSYSLQDGPRHSVRGRIFFTDSEWLVLFFVMEGDEPRRGSGEGGGYTLEGDRLVFTHLFHLSAGQEMGGLPESPLRMEARRSEGPAEPTRVEVAGDRMTLYFPSGNSMEFRRSSRSGATPSGGSAEPERPDPAPGPHRGPGRAWR